MKRKIISMLMAMMILLTTVDVTAFAAETTLSGIEVENVVEEETDDVEETEEEETTSPRNSGNLKEEGTSNIDETEDVGKKSESEEDSEHENIEEEITTGCKNTVIKEETVSLGSNSVENVASTVTVSGQCGDNLTWTLVDDTLTISGAGDMYMYENDIYPWNEYISNINNIVISDGVTSISDWAFCDINILSIDIPDSVYMIGEGVFWGCDALSSVELSNTMTEVPRMAFARCTSLKDIEILDNITTIGEEAFYYSGLETIVLPNSIIDIGEGSFSYCKTLNSVTLSDAMTEIPDVAFSDCYALKKINIGNNIVRIGQEAFYDSGLQTLDLPDSIVEIGAGAFCSCELTSIELPTYIKVIGSGAFDYTNITEVFIPKTLREASEVFNQFCLEKVTFEEGILQIPDSILYDCSKVTEITIPESVISIGEGAFAGCSALQEVIIPSSVSNIGEGAFAGCISITEVVIPDSVMTIGASAFEGCSSLTELLLPGSISEINHGTFAGCVGLQDVVIPSSVENIGWAAFHGCTGLTEITIPVGVKTIGSYAFESCSNLKKIILPETLIEIGKLTFSNTGIMEITIPKSLETCNYEIISDSSTGGMYFYEGPFANMNALIKVTVEEGMESLPANIFAGCEMITEIVLPDSMKKIGHQAFFNCKNLKEIELPSNIEWIGSCAFKRSGLISFTLPKTIKICEGIRCVPNLTTVNIESGLTEIPQYCFADYDNDYNYYGDCKLRSIISTIQIPDTVTKIKEYAFADLDSLEQIYIPNSVTEIALSAFSGCDNVIILGTKGSYAQEYAQNNNIPFIEFSYSQYKPTIFFTFETDRELEYTEGVGYNYSQINMDIAALCMTPLDNSVPTYENVTVTIELPEGLSFSAEAEERSIQKNLGTMSLSGTKRQDMSIPVYLDNEYFADELEVKISVTADGYTDSQVNTYYINVKEIPNYNSYDIQIYSEFSNCNIGIEQTMVLIPAMVKNNEPLKGEDGWTFSVKDDEVVEIQEYIDTEYGPAVRVKGKKQGNTELNILHISTGRSVSIIINVVDTTDFFNVTWLEKIEEDQGIYNAGIYMENFKTVRKGKGYDVSFDAYNGITLYGAVEVYNAKGELIEVERIDKFEQYQTGLKEVVLDFGNLIYTAFNGTIDSYKNTMYSKETNIEIWVPDDGYIYVSNNMSKSMGAHIYNMVDLSIWAFSVGNDIEKALSSSENKDAIIESTSKNVIKQYIEAVKSEVITDMTKEKFQEKLYKSLNKDVTKDLMSDLAGQLVTDSNAFFEELDIDLWEEVTDVAIDYGDGVLVEAFEKVGGPAGGVLSGIFKTNEYLNRFMQFVQIVKNKDSKEVKIYIDGNNDKLVSNDVIVENEEGKPIANNTLVVTDVSEDENSQYIIENFQSESKVKILDITMYRDNEEVQPDGKIRVKIPIPALYDKDKCVVYRAESDGTFTDMEAYYEDGFMIFETIHLSKYLLVEEFFYSITFDGNGESRGEVETLNYLKRDMEYTLPLNGFVKSGYVFNSWNTKIDGSGVSYTDGAIIKNLTEKNGDIVTLFAQWEKDDENEILIEDIPSDGIIPDGIWSAGIIDKTYTGSAIKQSFRVYDGTKLLKEKTDYTISYKNNKTAYTYLDEDYDAFVENLNNTGKKVKKGTFDPAKAPQVTIKMKGNYSGSKTIYFKIEQADISGEGFETADLTVTYTGKKQTPKPTLTWNGKAMKYGTDFFVPEYDNAKNDKKAFTEPQSEPYKLTVTGKKNFTGEIPITLTISNSKKQVAMNKVTVKGITNQKWNGGQITQTGFKVIYGKDILTEENEDYTISWGANSAVGTGTVTFTGTGLDTDGDGLSYIGTKTVSFKITGTLMSKVTVSGVKKSYLFTGTEIEPAVSLSYKANKNAQPIPLEEGIHYTVVYQKNVNKGTASIIFTGLESGGYSGTKKHTFKITAAGIGDITDGDVVTEQIQVSFKDTKKVEDGIYIAPHMKGGARPEVVITSGDKTLELNKDYTISYANNKKPALFNDKKAPSLTIKGKGNYTGSKKVYFTISPKALTNENGIKVIVKDKTVSSKKNGYRQSFKVYDSDGKALGSADYAAGNVVYTLIETQNEDGTVKEENRILDKKSIVPANSTIRITVPGKGNYAGGEAYATYRILENSHDISKATIQIENQEYTGQPVLITEQSQFKPGKVYIKIGKESKELILGEDIQVVPGSYVKHVDKGTAKVTFRGINDFGGTKTVSYKIGARSIEEFWKGIQSRLTNLFK